MPIPIEEFRKGKEPSTLYRFLESHPSKAFTARELAQELNLARGDHILEDAVGMVILTRELESLMRTGKVEARIVHLKRFYYAEPYYMFRGKR